MWEAINSWTVEVNVWNVLMILSTVAGVAFTGYYFGTRREAFRINDILWDLGIKFSEVENDNRIAIHEPENDQVILTITWDDEWINMDFDDDTVRPKPTS